LLRVVSDGQWTVPEAADRLGISRQAVQRTANDLVDDGLAVFGDNPRHRRSPFVQLTDEGRRVLDAITVQARRHQRALITKLDGIDLEKVRVALRHVTSVVRAELEVVPCGWRATRPRP
jgi:DNA-binding MarR family transcriptional regulator